MARSTLKHLVNKLTRKDVSEAPPPAKVEHGPAGIQQVGHREYVGGKWDQIGNLQFEFLKAQGLEPHHVFLDVGCGSLRGGVHIIPYLEAGNYLGIEKEQILIDAGIKQELGRPLYESKQPQLVVSAAFEFPRFTKVPDFALAQSLFTHLTVDHIDVCMKKLRAFVPGGCRFFATFRATDETIANPDTSHDRRRFHYTRARMEQLGIDNGWVPHYVGDWNHPRGQKMIEYVAD